MNLKCLPFCFVILCLMNACTSPPAQQERVFVQLADEAIYDGKTLTLSPADKVVNQYRGYIQDSKVLLNYEKFSEGWAEHQQRMEDEPTIALLSYNELGYGHRQARVELRNPRLVDGNLVYDSKVFSGRLPRRSVLYDPSLFVYEHWLLPASLQGLQPAAPAEKPQSVAAQSDTETGSEALMKKDPEMLNSETEEQGESLAEASKPELSETKPSTSEESEVPPPVASTPNAEHSEAKPDVPKGTVAQAEKTQALKKDSVKTTAPKKEKEQNQTKKSKSSSRFGDDEDEWGIDITHGFKVILGTGDEDGLEIVPADPPDESK